LTARRTLLVVDDEAEVREMLAHHFSLRQYRVLTAPDGAEALRLALAEKPGVIVLDVKMRGMDGDVLLERLRSLLPQARLIVVTAYQDARIRERLAQIGFDAYFEKPVPILELQRKVESFFNT
jgi:CheY-like chemotaxis protein